jgi:hypothetical protein
MDADEVPDGDRVSAFLERHGPGLEPSSAYKLSNYWYFLTPELRALEHEDSVLLVHSSWVVGADGSAALSHPRERDGIIMVGSSGDRRVLRRVTGVNGLPMFHHFSWVRSHADLLRKVRGWGHRGQRDWVGLLSEAVQALQLGKPPHTDFVHGYPLERVNPMAGIRSDLLMMIPPLIAR